MFSYGGVKYMLPKNNNNYCYYDNWDQEKDIRDRIIVNAKTRHSKIPAKNIDESYNRFIYVAYQKLNNKNVESQSHVLIDLNGLKIIDIDSIPQTTDLDKLLVKGFSRFHNNLDPYYVDTINVPNIYIRHGENNGRKYLMLYIDTEKNGILNIVLFDKERELVFSSGFQNIVSRTGGWGCLLHEKYGLDTDKYSLPNVTTILSPDNNFINEPLMSAENMRKIITDYRESTTNLTSNTQIPTNITKIYDNGILKDVVINNMATISSNNIRSSVTYKKYVQDENGDKVLVDGNAGIKALTSEKYQEWINGKEERIALRKSKLEEQKNKYRQMIQELCTGSVKPSVSEPKIFLFLLCPPHQGSTVLYKLLSTGQNISTLINAKVGDSENPIWAGEGQALLRQELFNGIISVARQEVSVDDQIKQNRRQIQKLKEDPNDTIIDFDCMFHIYSKYWDMDKKILCEKSPSFIRYAKQYENYYSQFGETYFISMIRNPYAVKDVHYSAKGWVENAQYIKQYESELQNNIVIRYEDLTDKLEETSQQLINFLPQLESLDTNVTNVEGIITDRAEAITNKNVFSNIAWKNVVLQNYKNLITHFGYDYIDA